MKPNGTAGGARLIEWLPVAMFVGVGKTTGTLQFGPVNVESVHSQVNERSSRIPSIHTPPYKHPVLFGPKVEFEQSPGPVYI